MRDASSVDRFRRRLLLTAPFALSAVLIGGCAKPAAFANDVAPALDARLAAADRAGFLALFATGAGAQALARRIYVNLSAQTGTTPRPAARIEAAGAGQLRVSWGYPGEPTVISLAEVAIDDGLISNISAHSSGTEWLGEPAAVRAEPALIVAAAEAAGLARWWAAAAAAVRALARVAPVALHAARPLVVLTPADLVDFGRYAGAGAERTAAVTVVPGTADSAGFRVVVNPMTPDDADADIATLTHEAVHAAMGSPRLTETPGWLLEGIAEALTARAHRSVAIANRALARTVIADGLPVTLPDTESGEPGSYALAQIAVDAMVEQVGWTRVLDEARRRSGAGGSIDDRLIMIWYREALARLA